MNEPLPTIPAPGPARKPPASVWSSVPSPGPAPTSSFSVGYLIGRSFKIWGRNVLLFALLGGLGNLPMAYVMYRFYSHFPTMADPSRAEEFLSSVAAMMGSFFLGWLVSLVAMSLMMAAVCDGAAQALRGEPVRSRPMLAAAIHRAPYVLAVMLLATLAAMATACTVVGPVLLMVGWCAAIPATVVERAGPIRALGRSWALSRAYRWQLFAGFAVLFVCLMMVSGILQGIATAAILVISGPSGLEPGPAMALPMAIYQVFAGMLGTLTTVGLAVAHHGLRAAKEGGDPVALAHVFE